MKQITTKSQAVINIDKIQLEVCQHRTLDVSKYGQLKCLHCNQIVTHINGELRSEIQIVNSKPSRSL